MFFSIERVRNVFVCVHDFSLRNSVLIAEISSRFSGFNVVWLSLESDDWWTDCKLSEPYTPTSSIESSLFQNVMRRAMREENMKRCETVVVSTHPRALRAAVKLLLGTIYLDLDKNINKTDAIDIGVDFQASSADDAASQLSGSTVGFATEFFAKTSINYQGTPWQATTRGGRLLSYGWLDNQETRTKEFYGGRYFSDCRHDLHPLSLRIIDSKKFWKKQIPAFREAFAFLIKCATSGNYDLIAHVPPKPGQQDRFKEILQEIHLEAELKEYGATAAQQRNDLLTCVRDYGSIKNFAAVQRKQMVQGAFVASDAVAGKRVVLLDDVRTTGSTTGECAKVLREAGAVSVVPICLAYKPFHDLNFGIEDTPPYSKCCDWPGSILVTKGGEVLYGCSAYHSGDKTSHKYQNFCEVRRIMLEQSEADLMREDDELRANVPY